MLENRMVIDEEWNSLENYKDWDEYYNDPRWEEEEELEND